MTKKIFFPCVINGATQPFEFSIGTPAEGSQPIDFQKKWLGTAKQGIVPAYIDKALSDLQKLSEDTKTPLEDLCLAAFAGVAEAKKIQNEGGSEQK